MDGRHMSGAESGIGKTHLQCHLPVVGEVSVMVMERSGLGLGREQERQRPLQYFVIDMHEVLPLGKETIGFVEIASGESRQPKSRWSEGMSDRRLGRKHRQNIANSSRTLTAYDLWTSRELLRQWAGSAVLYGRPALPEAAGVPSGGRGRRLQRFSMTAVALHSETPAPSQQARTT